MNLLCVLQEGRIPLGLELLLVLTLAFVSEVKSIGLLACEEELVVQDVVGSVGDVELASCEHRLRSIFRALLGI